jgi:hypothetical protein
MSLPTGVLVAVALCVLAGVGLLLLRYSSRTARRFLYWTARLLALVVVYLATLFLMVGAVTLVAGGWDCLGHVPNQAAILALQFGIAVAVAFGLFGVVAWVVKRARRKVDGPTPEAVPETRESGAPAVRERFREELVRLGLEPDAVCVFVSTGCAAGWLSAALHKSYGLNKASQVLAGLAIPELSRAKGCDRGWCWRGVNARRGAAMKSLPYPRPREREVPAVAMTDRLLATFLGAIAGLLVAPLFCFAASALLAPRGGAGIDREVVARSCSALLPPCALVAGLTCVFFGAVRGFYYGGPVGIRLFVQCVLDSLFLTFLGNVRLDRERMAASAFSALLSLACFAWLGYRVYLPPTSQHEPSGLFGRTTMDFMEEFEHSAHSKDWWSEARWWGGLFSYLGHLLLAGLLAWGLVEWLGLTSRS